MPVGPPQETGRYPAYKEMVSEYCWLDRCKWLSPRVGGEGLRLGSGSLKKVRVGVEEGSGRWEIKEIKMPSGPSCCTELFLGCLLGGCRFNSRLAEGPESPWVN